MVNKLAAAAETDPAAEAGAWFTFAPAGEGFEVKLARAGANNKEFGKLMEQRVRPFRAGVRNPNEVTIPDHIERKINAEVYARTVVLDWKEDQVGEPFSVDNCIRAFEQAPDFLLWVMNASNNADAFRKQRIDENAGN